MVGLETPKSSRHLSDGRRPAAEPLDDLAPQRVRERPEHIVSHCANYMPREPRTGGGADDRAQDRHAEEWKAQRDELLREEKELTRRGDELARKRRELPWVPVEEEYRFETEDGTKTLAELFDGRAQLVVYHFMFGPPYEAGCPVCSSIADTLAPQVPHLEARDTTLLLASRAPLEKLLAFRERMGWRIGWVSSGGNDFNRDLGFLHTPERVAAVPGRGDPAHGGGERPRVRDRRGRLRHRGPGAERVRAPGRDVYRTYVTTARGLEVAMGYYGLLDRTPKGRDEDPSEALWIRRHDEYEPAGSAGAGA